MAKTRVSLGRVVTAMVTPFDDSGNVDINGAGELANWLHQHGSDSLVLCGSTGEGSLLSDQEREDLYRAVVSSVPIPVVAATGSADTVHSIDLTRSAEKCGVDAILLVTPYYVRPSQDGLKDHFRKVANSTELPVVLYDIPVRSGRRIEVSTTLELASSVDNIVGIKDASQDVGSISRIVGMTGEDFQVYCGDDSLCLAMVACGAIGVISVASHWAGDAISAMLDAVASGDIAQAANLNFILGDSWDFESGPDFPNPLPTKALLRTLGLPAGRCRPPLGSSLDELALENRAREVLHELAQKLSKYSISSIV